MKKIALLAIMAAIFDAHTMQNPLEGTDTTPIVSTNSMAEMIPIFNEMGKVCKEKGTDFSVHAFDALITAHLNTITTCINERSPLDKSKDLPEIEKEMLDIINNSDDSVKKENDLNAEHLQRAMYFLQNLSPHKTLIPIFRQIYTIIFDYPERHLLFVLSFLSNVNKFKGAECFPGFRNRIIINFLQAINPESDKQ
jgi:hypothetical protein